MKATLEKIENNVANLEIEVPESEVSKAIAEEYRRFAQKVTLPGFRKGKAPRRVLEMRFGKGIFYKEVLESLLPKAYAEALEEMKLEPIDEPKIDIVDQIEEGKPLKVKAIVPVKPEVRLGNYRDIRVEKKKVTVTDEDVEKNLEALREQRAKLVDIERDIVEKGDLVAIDYVGYLGENPIGDEATKDYVCRVGEGEILPEIDEALIGARVGEEIEVGITFPEEYRDKTLAGKEAVFKVKVQHIMRKELPGLDDEFAKATGDFDTLEELKAEIRRGLEEFRMRQEDARVRQEVIDKVVATSEVDIPGVMVEREVDHMMRDFQGQLERQKSSLEKYLESLGMDEASFRGTFREEAEKRVKRGLVLEAIAGAEGITASEDEVNTRIDGFSRSYGKSRGEMRALLEKQGNLKGIRNAIVIDKVGDFLVSVCTEEGLRTEEESEESLLTDGEGIRVEEGMSAGEDMSAEEDVSVEEDSEESGGKEK